MPRVKRSVHARKKRRKVLEQAKGYWGLKSTNYRYAKEQVEHSLVYAYRDRKVKKRTFRRLWIMRINAGARAHGLSYNQFVAGLKAAGVELDRKVLADLAVSDPEAFGRLAAQAKAALLARGRPLRPHRRPLPLARVRRASPPPAPRAALAREARALLCRGRGRRRRGGGGRRPAGRAPRRGLGRRGLPARRGLDRRPSAARDRRLPARAPAGPGARRGHGRGVGGEARAARGRRPRERRRARPLGGCVRRRRRPRARLCGPDLAEGAPRVGRLDLARPPALLLLLLPPCYHGNTVGEAGGARRARRRAARRARPARAGDLPARRRAHRASARRPARRRRDDPGRRRVAERRGGGCGRALRVASAESGEVKVARINVTP